MSDENKKPLPEVYSKEKLNQLYSEIPLSEEQVQFFTMYCYSFTHFYGMIPLVHAWKIINQQNPELFQQEQFLAFAEVARHSGDIFSILGDNEVYLEGTKSKPEQRTLYSLEVLMDPKEFQLMRQYQQGKPYFVPEKSVLLHFVDPYYCEPCPEVKAVKTALVNLYPGREKKVEQVFQKIVKLTRKVNRKAEDVLKVIGAGNLPQDQVSIFMDAYRDFNNHMRMPCNLGQTPAELDAKLNPKKQEKPQRKSYLTSEIRRGLASGKVSAHHLYQQILYMDLKDERERAGMLREITELMALKNNIDLKDLGNK